MLVFFLFLKYTKYIESRGVYIKKGFTLIELLAVIVILAIIAVIAVPIVLNIIEDAKESATLRSAEFYIDGVEMTIATSILKNKEVKDGTYSITEDGNLCIGAYLNTTCTGDILNIEVNGTKPNKGYVQIQNGSIKDIGVSISDKVIVKNEKEELVLGDRLKSKYTPGVYNEDDELIKTWEELNEIAYNMYGMNFKELVESDEAYDWEMGSNGYAGDVVEEIQGAYQLILDDSVTRVGEYVFLDNDNLKEIIIPDSVKSIGSAFDISNIQSITIGSGVTEIANWSDCWQLTTIIVDPDNPKYDSRDNSNAIIETTTNTLMHGFSCTVIPDSVTSIGDSAFFYTSLETITIPASVTSIGKYAFSDNYDLTEVTILSSEINIADSAFDYCDNLTTIYYKGDITGATWIPDGVTVVSDF